MVFNRPAIREYGGLSRSLATQRDCHRTSANVADGNRKVASTAGSDALGRQCLGDVGGQQRHTVVGLLPGEHAAVAQPGQHRVGELVVLHLGFLAAVHGSCNVGQHVALGVAQLNGLLSTRKDPSAFGDCASRCDRLVALD
jgi:hypothetical protein